MIKFETALIGSLPKNSEMAVYFFEKGKKPVVSTAGLPNQILSLVEQCIDDGFEGQLGQVSLVHPDKSLGIKRVFFIGLGNEADSTHETIRRATAYLCKRANWVGSTSLNVYFPKFDGKAQTSQAIVEGAILGTYRFTQFKSKIEKEFPLSSIRFIVKDKSEKDLVDLGVKKGIIFSNATNLIRDLVNTPPSDMTPEIFATHAKKHIPKNVQVKVLGKREIEKLKMGAFLGVNRGSHKPPVFLHLIYKPAGAKKKIGICGKGITFDSGGLSLKPAKSMETMKYDMAGAATVVALFSALGQLKPKVEVHGFTPLTENMPGGNALKPGDVLKAMTGKTIEVLNTDAEGRLVLSDTLAYACKQNLDEIVDLATLTGACTIALGNNIAAILGTNPQLINRIKHSGELAGEKLWELPLEKDYESHIKSKVADLKNIGQPMVAGTIIGGLFLKEFVNPKTPWAHIDIASTGWTDEEKPLSPVGATGVMVRTLLNYILSYDGN